MRRIWGFLCALVTVFATAVWLAPSAAAATRPGTVIGVERLPASELPSGAARGVRLLYETRDQGGRPGRSYGAVYYPAGAAPRGGWKVVSWAHGTSGISEPCAPSRSSGAERDRLEPTISAALKRGYVVAATDYIGLGGGDEAEYLGGRSEAHSVIDMIRAARHHDPAISADWVSTGHSQGGHTALWAAWLAHSYAPELHLHGAVPLAPASHTDVIFSAFGPSIPYNSAFNTLGGLALYGMDGLNAARPDLHVLDYLTPIGRREAQRAKRLCVFDAAKAFAHESVGSLFARPLSNPTMTAAIRDYTAVPTSGWTVPVRIEQGTNDAIVLFPVTLALVAEMRAGGADVSMVPYPGAGHPEVVGRSIPDTLATIADYFRR